MGRISVFNRQSYFKRRERQNKTLLFWHFLPFEGIFLTCIGVSNPKPHIDHLYIRMKLNDIRRLKHTILLPETKNIARRKPRAIFFY